MSPDAIDLFQAEGAGLLSGRVAWVFGNEAHGLPEDVLRSVDHVVRIPILGHAESLNLASAAAVCMYSALRLGPRGRPGPVESERSGAARGEAERRVW